MANISIKRGSNGGVTISKDGIGAFSLSGPVNLQQITGGVSIHPHNTTGLTFEQSRINVLTSDTITVNDVAYSPADAAALHTKLRDEVFFLTNKQVKQVIATNVQLSHTGSTTETTVFTGTIPANSIGPNGNFLISWVHSQTNNANNKTLRIKFNGTVVVAQTTTTMVAFKGQISLHNRNSMTSQVYSGFVGQGGGGTAPLGLTSFNTSQDITVTVTVTLANATDTMSLEVLQILAIP